MTTPLDTAPATAGPARIQRVVGWWKRHPTLAVAVVYAVLSLIMVGQGLLPGRTFSASDLLYRDTPWRAERPADVPRLGSNLELADAVVVFQPFQLETREVLPHIPLWNPHISAGRPYLANTQSAVFSPFNFPAYVLPYWKSLAVIAALKLFIAAFGTFLLARALGMRFGGALLSGVVFAFGTFFIVWLAWPLTAIFPLIPWLLLLAELTVRRPGPLPAAGLAGVVALAYFGGHPETTFHALFVTVVFFLFRLALRARAERVGLRPLVRPVVAFGLALVAGTAIAAVMLVPFAELLLHSGDLARRKDLPAGFWPRKYLGALFLHDYWGRPTQGDLAPFMQIRGWYAGGLTLMLAAAAVILRPTATRVAVAVFGVFATTMVIGLGPVFHFLTDHVPGFNGAHNQRMLIYVLLGLALLAGWGLDDLARRELPRPSRRAAVLATAGLIFCVPFVWLLAAGTLKLGALREGLEVAWGFRDPRQVDASAVAGTPALANIVHASALLQWIPLAGLGLALIGLRLWPARRLAVVPFVVLAVAVLTVDLFRANMGFNPSIRTSTAVMPRTPAIDYLQSQRPNRFVGLGPDFSFQPLPPDMAMQFGLYDARGYDYPAEKRYDTLWRRSVAPGVSDFTQPIVIASSTPAAVRALNLLSVTDFLQDPVEKPLHEPGLRLVYRGRDGRIYRSQDALPRVFLVDRQQTVQGESAALDAVTKPGFDGRRVAVTEHRVAGLPEGSSQGAGSTGSARLVSYGAEKVVTDASASRTSLMVLTDVYYPGWKATVDGHSVPIERVNYLLRGVVLPPGRHRVELRYEPASFRAGWIVSLLGLVAVLGAALVGVRDLRRRRAAAGG